MRTDTKAAKEAAREYRLRTGARLRKWRKSKGYTLMEVANTLGTSRDVIAYQEQHGVTTEWIPAFCALYNRPPGALMKL